MKSFTPYLLLFALLFASCKQAKLSDARAQYLRGEYFTAAETYRKLYRETPREQRALRGVIAYEMAENHRRLNQSARAATAYANAIRYEYPDTMMLLRYAQMLHREAKYPQAAEQYADFLALKPDNSLAQNGLHGTRQAEYWLKNPARYVVNRMDVFNSRRGEFSPMLAQNGGALYFSSSRDDARGDAISLITGMKYSDLYISQKNERGEWQRPQRLESDINTEWDEGTPSFSPDGNSLFYTSSAADADTPNAPKIYVSRRAAGVWSAGREVRVASTDSVSVFAHPAASPDGRYLYFVSDMAGGYGGKDIWRAGISANNEMLFTENLGPEINTAGDEMFPYVHRDGALYFASDGHAGMGGLDIFKAVFQSNSASWSVENMRFPINSSADDFGITFEENGEKGFFSSNRGDARGYDHIYSFENPSVAAWVEGLVTGRDDELISAAAVTVIGNDGSQRQLATNRDGVYRFQTEPNVHYVFMAAADGFLNLKKSLRTSPLQKDTLYYVDFEMTPYNKPVILENIFYDFDRATLRPESKEELDGLIALLNDNPEIAIELSAHTDRKGAREYNQSLSLRRAQSVVNYLVMHGIEKNRLTAEGYGKSQPKTISPKMAQQFDFLPENGILSEEFIETLAPEQQEIADQMNRRTEFRVTDDSFGLH